jgi:hypothetical protein
MTARTVFKHWHEPNQCSLWIPLAADAISHDPNCFSWNGDDHMMNTVIANHRLTIFHSTFKSDNLIFRHWNAGNEWFQTFLSPPGLGGAPLSISYPYPGKKTGSRSEGFRFGRGAARKPSLCEEYDWNLCIAPHLLSDHRSWEPNSCSGVRQQSITHQFPSCLFRVSESSPGLQNHSIIANHL